VAAEAGAGGAAGAGANGSGPAGTGRPGADDSGAAGTGTAHVTGRAEGAGAARPGADGARRAGTGSAGRGSAGAGRPGSAGAGARTEVVDEDDLADPNRLRAAIEAVLLVVDTPLGAMTLAQVLGRAPAQVEGALRALRDEYDGDGRGLDLREVADGWRLYSRDDFAAYVERFVLDGQQARLTQAALETLAVIAYRQPVTRSRISGIRGVSVDAVMRTLLTRGLVEECGADPVTGGGLYRTTRLFLEKLGLRSLDELPSLAPLLPDTSQLDDVELST
jgi:segregation and condensation protein B